jgi:hypothetical protein
MRVLLLHPEDDFLGPWKRERWDRVVDLGRAPKSFYDEQSAALGCPVSSIYDLALEVEDLQVWRGLLAKGRGRVVDRAGIDWWDVIGLLLQSEMQDIRLALRLAEKLSGCRTLVASRPSILAEAVRLRLGIPLQVLQSGVQRRLANRATRYKTALANLSFEQLRQVVYDKYDPHYRWRRRFAASAAPSPEPVILLPSAYSNVTKTTLKYARLLPEQQFLLVLARESAAVSSLPANVRTAPLAAFAQGDCDRGELRELENRWMELERSLGEHPEYSVPVQLGIVRKGLRWLRWGVPIRDAWSRVLETQSVVGCLSADDSNPYTRIPLLLASRQEIPAVACHHGALDGGMAIKAPCFSTYLAQGEMERDYLARICGVDPGRIRIGAAGSPAEQGPLWRPEAPWIVFFTEPHEVGFWRTGAVYREVLPRLCAAARASGKAVVLKLHPFETARQRRRLVKATLSESDQKLVTVMDAPLSAEILRNTWCAVTVESTVAFECASVGIPAFLCGWMRHAYSGYALQYARYGVGNLLGLPDELLDIPKRIANATPSPGLVQQLVQPVRPQLLAEVLCGAR